MKTAPWSILPSAHIPVNDRQSHARTFEFVGAMQTLEDTEQFPHIVHAETHAIVFDDVRALGGAALPAQCNRGLLGFAAIFQCVGNKVDPYLAQQPPVGMGNR